MTQAKYKQPQEKIGNPRIKRRVSEAILIIIIAIAAFLLLALCTYNHTDPGWSHTGVTTAVANKGGYVGAWLADVLFCSFGYIAYLFPLLLIYAALMPLLQRGFNYSLTIIRVLGFLLILVTASTLASLYFTTHYLPEGAGGIIGDLLDNVMVSTFSQFGASLLLTALLLTGITLFSGLSWLKIIDLTGRGMLYLADNIGKLILKIFSWRPPEKVITTDKPKIIPKIVTPKEPIAKVTPEKQESPVQPSLSFAVPSGTAKPSLELLDSPDVAAQKGYSQEQLEYLSREVELRLKDFNIEAQVVAVHPGPVVTRFELQLAAGTKASKITNLAKDLARSLSVTSVRVVEVIPGKSVVGLELPNEERETVKLREILSSKQYRNAHSPLSLALGKDIAGNPVIVDLAKMPHLLVAGTTGSGKSVGLNAILLSLLFKYSPQEIKLILIDPKMLELSVYDNIPHLLTPVVTDMKDAANALRWCVGEMERRYKLMASLGVRNLIGYNNKVKDAKKKGAPLLDPLWQRETGEEPEELQELPYIVVFADEYADMMMVVGKKVEELIARIAQKARAAGIHLVLATQRPSVDVITGLIKANIPSRIAFQVSSKIDSRTILDQMGAEQLLGSGDMLYLPPGTAIPVRIHGAFVTDEEVHKVAADLKSSGQPVYIQEILDGNANIIPGIDGNGSSMDDGGEQDAIYDQAVQFVIETRRVSISSIQRRFKIGYNRAARIVEAMEVAKVVSAMENNGNREVLVDRIED